MLQAKRVFKVVSPIERPDGTKWWMNCGNGFPNKDDSINMYISALPVAAKNGTITLQLREVPEAELRERAERRASYQARGTVDDSFGASRAMPPLDVAHSSDAVPF